MDLQLGSPSHTQPSLHLQSPRPKKSRYRGVYKCGRKWKAQIQLKGRQYYLGLFENEKEAAKAYDSKAREEKGTNAQCNFDEEGRESLSWSKRSRSDELEGGLLSPVQGGITLPQLHQALYLTGRLPGLSLLGSGGDNQGHNGDGSQGDAHSTKTAVDAMHVNLMFRRRLEGLNLKLKEIQEAYASYEKLPDGNEKNGKLQSASKDIMMLLDEKSKIVDLIAASSQAALVSPNLSMLDLAHLQNALVQAYAMQQGAQLAPQDSSLPSSALVANIQQRSLSDLEGDRAEGEVSVAVEGPLDQPDESEA